MRILLLVTTHFPAYHQSFLETCWPPATRKSVLLQQADVMVFATGAVSDQNRAAVATAFDACKSTRVVAVPNPGKRNGAMLPLQMAEREGEIEQRAAEIARLQKQVAALQVANSELNRTVEQVTSLFRRFVGALPMQGEDVGGLGAGTL